MISARANRNTAIPIVGEWVMPRSLRIGFTKMDM